MQAIELETEIDENREIHLKLPSDVQARKARVVVLYEQPATQAPEQHPEQRPIKLGLFRDQIWMSDDFDDPLPDDFWLCRANIAAACCKIRPGPSSDRGQGA